MASFLDVFPREIRDKVYRELLLKHWVPISISGSTYVGSIPLHPQILRVCKQTYNEGCQILYGENVFSYNPPNQFLNEESRKLPDEAIQKIAHLESVCHDMWNFSSERILETAEFLIDQTLCLRSLHLSFCFLEWRGPYGWSESENDELHRLLPDDGADLKNAIASVSISRELVIELDSFGEVKGPFFQDFVRSLAGMKLWTVREEYSMVKFRPCTYCDSDDCSATESVAKTDPNDGDNSCYYEYYMYYDDDFWFVFRQMELMAEPNQDPWGMTLRYFTQENTDDNISDDDSADGDSMIRSWFRDDIGDINNPGDDNVDAGSHNDENISQNLVDEDSGYWTGHIL